MIFFPSIRLFERDRLALHSDMEYYILLLKAPRVRDVSQVRRDRSGWPDSNSPHPFGSRSGFRFFLEYSELAPECVSDSMSAQRKKKERIDAALHIRDAYLMAATSFI